MPERKFLKKDKNEVIYAKIRDGKKRRYIRLISENQNNFQSAYQLTLTFWNLTFRQLVPSCAHRRHTCCINVLHSQDFPDPVSYTHLDVYKRQFAIPGFIGWILPIFIYRNMVSAKKRKLDPLIEQKYEEIYDICEKGNHLLF